MFKKSLIVMLCSLSSYAHANFDIVTLGSKGGIQDGNLTAFLLKNSADSNFVTLDAGSIVNGLIVADQQQAFENIVVPENSPYTKIGYVLREKIKGYFISHAHLDHIAGMIISSPDDSKKPIYGLPSVTQTISDTYFNWQAWPNFGNNGKGYQLGKYHYVNLDNKQWSPVSGTSMQVKAFPLSHSGTESTAFLFQNEKQQAIAYFGDTGPDEVEKSNAISNIWSNLVPFIKADTLKGIMIEVSFTNDVADRSLFGHLTPNWLMTELKKLEQQAGGKGSLAGLNIVITHIKYSLKKAEDPEQVIKQQLNEANTLGVNFIFPKQGETFKL